MLGRCAMRCTTTAGHMFVIGIECVAEFFFRGHTARCARIFCVVVSWNICSRRLRSFVCPHTAQAPHAQREEEMGLMGQRVSWALRSHTHRARRRGLARFGCEGCGMCHLGVSRTGCHFSRSGVLSRHSGGAQHFLRTLFGLLDNGVSAPRATPAAAPRESFTIIIIVCN